MRMSPIKKLTSAAAIALALVLTTASMAGAASATIAGTITIHTSPDTVITIPGAGTDPCQDDTGYTFDVTDDTANSELDVSIAGKGVFPKPGTSDWDFLDFTVNGSLPYASTNPYVFGPTAVVVSIDVTNIDSVSSTTCEAGASKCSLVALIEVSGELDGLSSSDTGFVIGSSDPNGVPITFLGGDGCGAYSSIIGSHLSVDLGVTID